MKIIIGCDNAAVELKNQVIELLKSEGHEVINIGVDSVDDTTYYPEVASKLCKEIQSMNFTARGILICGTGLGMTMTANKFKGIRAALCNDTYSAERAMLSNNSNVLCFGSRVLGPELAKKIVSEWISLEFKDGRSTAKVQEMIEIDNENFK